jgi:uroporphyrinogen-III synthase
LIPLPLAPLTGVTALVTRPMPQAQSLCARIAALGGTGIAFPAIAIEPIEIAPSQVAACDGEFDWLIFISAHAVQYGLDHCRKRDQTRIAAIGNATAAELARFELQVDAAPRTKFTSEALLEHPAFATIANQHVLIVKGVGGREVLVDALTARGARVATLDVYRRVRPTLDANNHAMLEDQWRDELIDVVTLTSVEIMENLLAMLGSVGRAAVRSIPYVALSERIVAAAQAHGFAGTPILARSGDDDAIVGAIAAWHARAR